MDMNMDMSMTTSAMSMAMTGTPTSMAMASGSAMGASMSMDMPMSTSTAMSMDMGMEGMGGDCKISMLWNWYTVDACFISSTWRVSSPGIFALSCIGVILLVMSLAALRKVHRGYDARIRRRLQSAALVAAELPPASGDQSRASSSGAVEGGCPNADIKTSAQASVAPLLASDSRSRAWRGRPSPLEQAGRALLHMAEFAVAYFVMLLAMYYNGYIIICILIGAFLGYFVFEWNVIEGDDGATEVTGCCG